MPCQDSCKKHIHHPSGIVKQAVRRTLEGKALFLACSVGEPGSGKSEFNVLLGSKIQEAKGLGPINPANLKHQLRFKPKDFPAASRIAPFGVSMFCDEGSGEGANKMQPTKAENVEVGIDLDALRGRRQPVFWANPYRMDLTRQVQKHATWVFEFHLDFSMEAFEVIKPSAAFGKEIWLESRFELGPGKVPWLQDHDAALRAEYLRLKDRHSRGLSLVEEAREDRLLESYLPVVQRVLGPRRLRPSASE